MSNQKLKAIFALIFAKEYYLKADGESFLDYKGVNKGIADTFVSDVLKK